MYLLSFKGRVEGFQKSSLKGSIDSILIILLLFLWLENQHSVASIVTLDYLGSESQSKGEIG